MAAKKKSHGIVEALAEMAWPMSDLSPYDGNPRRGDVETIKESLVVNGQYRPIVANRRTNQILAGNHTYAAAAALGWTHIAVTWVEADDDQAARIVLADNRHSDLGSYDQWGLLELLESVGDLGGTGYDDSDIRRLKSQLGSVGLFDERQASPVEAENIAAEPARVQVGAQTIWVPTPDFMGWAEALEAVHGPASKSGGSKDSITAIEDELRIRLGLEGTAPEGKPRQVRDGEKAEPPEPVGIEGLAVDIEDLVPYDLNPRQGDVGAIYESLRTNGQFRPIVVRYGTNEILAGNHTWHAARALGWEQIAATFVDVDDEGAKRIVLVDNRASDLGYYDGDELASLLRQVPALHGTGYELTDLADLMRGVGGWRPDGAELPKRAKAPVMVMVKHRESQHVWRVPVDREKYDEWYEGVMREARYNDSAFRSLILGRLGLAVTIDLATGQVLQEAQS